MMFQGRVFEAARRLRAHDASMRVSRFEIGFVSL